MAKPSLETLTCKAAVCWGPSEPVVTEEIQVEPPRSSEVRIKMLCASICHTDILYWKGYETVGPSFFPRVFGHEGVGVVESVGEGVTEVEKGDIVIPAFIGECKDCMACKSGKTNLCHKHPLPLSGLMPNNTARMSVKGQTLYHMFSCSTWSQYTVLNVNYVVKVDPRVALMDASLLSCGFSTGFGAAWKVANVGKGSTVAVFGLGAVGLGAVGAAQMMGADRIIGVDVNDMKKEKGVIMGMTDFVNPNNEAGKSAPELIKELTGGLGVDFSFECTGVAPVVNQALQSTTPGIGVSVVIGEGQDPTVPFGLMDLLAGRTLKGSIFGGIKPHSDLPVMVNKCISKELQLDAIITHQLEMENINEAFELVKQPECLKIVIWMERSYRNQPSMK